MKPYKDGKERVNVNLLDTYTKNVARGAKAWIKKTKTSGYIGVEGEQMDDTVVITAFHATDVECADELKRLGYIVENPKA